MLMSLAIFAEGKEYISASRAAEKSGYSSDYIGQLCRAKKIPGKLIGKTWYVEFPALLEHKKSRQSGKKRLLSSTPYKPAPFLSTAGFTYSHEDLPLLPTLSKNIFPVDRKSTRLNS